jgi:hypothetical protein
MSRQWTNLTNQKISKVKFVLVVQDFFAESVCVCMMLRNDALGIRLEKCFSNTYNFRPLFTLKLHLQPNTNIN